MSRLKSRPVNISQVAGEAGVSTQTVSRVINNRPDVAPETRERVQRVISRLGYRPNAIARSLIRQRSHTLGVVASGLDYYGPSRVLVGIEQGADEQGYSLLLSLQHQPDADNVERLLGGLLSRQVDGIVWAVPEIGNNRSWLRDRVPELTVPVIFLSMQPHAELPVVCVDNRTGGRIATEHLLAQGRRNVGLITGPLSWWEARERQRGSEEALTAAGIVTDKKWIVEGNWSPASGERGLRQLLETDPAIDAVFASNDQMALGVLQVARALGRRVPEDLAVIGFDDIPESAYFWPSLSTVRQDLVELGCRAVQELIQLMETMEQRKDGVQHRAILLPPQLIVRESSVK